jgi:hypothetical protein
MSSRSDCSYRDLPRAKELLPSRIVRLASAMFARDTGLSGPQIFEFFSKFSDEIGKMRYGSGVPSRWQMFENFLESLPVEQQRKALLELCDFPLRNAPSPLDIDELRDKLRGVPVPIALGRAVEQIDSTYVMKQWEKLIGRLVDDPEGAITSARTLLETVCLHILEGLGKETNHRGDLPALYKVTAAELQLLPRKEDEDTVRQILGSCSGLVLGIATLRNQFGDAHGRLAEGSQKRLAHLAANTAGALCIFLIESYEELQSNI